MWALIMGWVAGISLFFLWFAFHMREFRRRAWQDEQPYILEMESIIERTEVCYKAIVNRQKAVL